MSPMPGRHGGREPIARWHSEGHAVLDDHAIPRTDNGGWELTLAERIQVLADRASAPLAQVEAVRNLLVDAPFYIKRDEVLRVLNLSGG